MALELLTSLRLLEEHPPLSIELKVSWRWIYLRIVPFLLSAYLRLKRKAERREIDTILFSSMVTAMLSIPLRPLLKAHNIRTAVIVHGQDVTMPLAPYQDIVRSVFSTVDAVLPVSEATADACRRRGLDREKIFVVHNGVDTSRFEPPADPSEMRSVLRASFGLSEEDLPDGALLLCSVGRHVKRKGFAWFVGNVMPLLPERVHYYLAGDGPERESIRRMVDDLNLSDRVRPLGRVSDRQLKALYRGSDIFIMPNIPVPGDMEGFGIVMLEAGMNGLPSIAARLEGITEVIADGENGRCVEAGDARGFVSAISEFEKDLLALARAGDRARAYTRDTFGWDRVAERYADVLSSLS